MELRKAQEIAERVKSALASHCIRIEIAGSVRRGVDEVKDIEIVAIPKPYEIGLFESGIATVVNQWPKIKGDLPCKYTQRVLPDGITLDLFFARKENWGLIYAIRTGSAEFSNKRLAARWVSQGYTSHQGMLMANGRAVPILEEEDLFRRLSMDWVPPHDR